MPACSRSSKSSSCRTQPKRPDALSQPALIGQWPTQNELKLASRSRAGRLTSIVRPRRSSHPCAGSSIPGVTDHVGDLDARAGARRHAVRRSKRVSDLRTPPPHGARGLRLATDSLRRGAAHWHCLVGQRAHAAAPGDLVSGLGGVGSKPSRRLAGVAAVQVAQRRAPFLYNAR
jgi:hypothetical protein